MASNRQDLRQKTSPQHGEQSMAPNMTTSLRPTPELSSYNAVDSVVRPSRDQYGRVPGMVVGNWPLKPTHDSSPQPLHAVSTPPVDYTPQPYREANLQSATALPYQKPRESADLGFRDTVAQQYQERARSRSNQQILGPAFHNAASPPPPHFYDGRNDVLGSGPYPSISNAQDRFSDDTMPPPYDGRIGRSQISQSPNLGQYGYPSQATSQSPYLAQRAFQGQPIYHNEQTHQDHQRSKPPQFSPHASQGQIVPHIQDSQLHHPVHQPTQYDQDFVQGVQQEQPFHYGQQISYLSQSGEQTYQTQSLSPGSLVYEDQQMRQNRSGYPNQPIYHGQAALQAQMMSQGQPAQAVQSNSHSHVKDRSSSGEHGQQRATDKQTFLAQQRNQDQHSFEARHSNGARRNYEAENNSGGEPEYTAQSSYDEQQRNDIMRTTESQQSQQGQDTEYAAVGLFAYQDRQVSKEKPRTQEQQLLPGSQNGQAQQKHEKHTVLHKNQNRERPHDQHGHHTHSYQMHTRADARETTRAGGTVAYIPTVAPHRKLDQPSLASLPTAAPLSGHGIPRAPTVAPKTLVAPRSTSQPPGLRSASQPNPQSHRLHKSSQPNLLKPRHDPSPDLSPNSSPKLRGRDRSDSNSAIPTIGSINIHGDSNQLGSYHSDAGSSDGKSSKLRSWIPGNRSRQTSEDMTAMMNGPPAWVLGGPNKVAYDMLPLKNAETVPELWDDSANMFVYLYPPESRQGPSFRVLSSTISSSHILRKLAFGSSHTSNRHRAKSFDGRNNLSVNDARHKRNSMTPPYTPTLTLDNQMSSTGSAESLGSPIDQVKEGHLFYPFDFNKDGQTIQQVVQEEYDHLLSARNLFAFLTCRPLVATRSCQTIFAILNNIANELKRLEFSNVDGSTFGEVASASLNFYIDNLGLADVRNSREKTLEGIVLGERLRSVELYNEAFTHAVGKYEAIMEMKLPIWNMITSNTRNRLERAFMDLTQRQHSVQLRLSDFEFPSLFVGYAASNSTAASKVIRFRSWKTSFLALRRHILSYYKDMYGDWPPKAKSKKNQFSISGLNRLVLNTLYSDFCAIYDLLVDRESLTTRSMDIDDIMPEEVENITATAMRKVLTEYDRSSPPVQPPVPFDLPKIPIMTTLNARHNEHPLKSRQQAENRKLQGNETILLLAKSHNLDSKRQTPFLQAFQNFEEKEARGRNVQELADQRCGYWLFLYVVLQALPMVVIDAPGLKFTQGVEYFLCQPPKGGVPWVEDAMAMRKTWYGVDGGSKVVALPSDSVHHSVEAVYRRSHCWIVAKKWLEAGHGPAEPDEEQHSPVLATDGRVGAPFMPLVPPPIDDQRDEVYHPAIQLPEDVYQSTVQVSTIREDAFIPLPQSGRPRARSATNHRKSIALGLEQLSVPPGYDLSSRLSPTNSPRHSPPLGNQQQETAYGLGIENHGRRTQGNLEGTDDQGKSFDDILSALQDEKEKKRKESGMRRKSFMGF